MSHYLAPLAFLIVVAAIVLLASGVANHSLTTSPPRAAHHGAHRLPPYWTVHPGDTLDLIAQKTGLTTGQLEAFNPNANPDALFPGERLNLWRHPPKPRPKPPMPHFWLVRSGQSFGWIAARTGIDITRLEQLNPNLKPATLQPGDRLRLRP